ncbi:hypothetical protein JTB14_020954 [Gonioctena quinquepunctata]|nr:hypothetical protein JTB14_020954 [Gonioctena quinquepunctata]
MNEDLNYTIQNIQQQLSANRTASCYNFLKDEIQEQWKPIQQLHYEIIANAPNIEEHYLTSHWALKEKYQQIMEELYIKIRNNQSIPSPIFSREPLIKINQSVKQENSIT